MTIHDIQRTMENYVSNQEMAGGHLVVRKNDEIVFDEKWGCSDLKKRTPISDSTIFRMASMTKIVTAVGVMKLMEEGLIELDAPLSRYLPEFKNMRVCNDPRYAWSAQESKLSLLSKMVFFRPEKVKTIEADREVTIRDLLSHASGLQQGMVGLIAMMKHRKEDTLEERIAAYSRYILDFQPGTSTSYSPAASFDILGYLLGKLTGETAEDAYRKLIFQPLDMKSASFKLENKENLARTYIRKKEKLVDVSGTSKDLEGIIRTCRDSAYVAGCGGLYCTVKDYEKLGRMLSKEGDGYLRPETVRLMASEAQKKHMEPTEGQVWGLGVRIRQKDDFCSPGTYGWSGALGTHFFVSPRDQLEVVFATSRADLGGSGSYISRKVEELVFGIWKN